MGRFLERQLSAAENMKLGRVESYCNYTPETGVFEHGQRAADAAKNPPNTMKYAFPVGRSNGVCIPGSESK